MMKSLKGKSKGMTLIEVLIALAILGVIAVAFLAGLTTALRGVIIADEHAVAQSLAASQFESVKNQNYTVANNGADATYAKIDLSTYIDYDITGVNRDGDVVNNVTGIPFNPDTGATVEQEDMGIQSVTIKVYRSSKLLLTLTDYKVYR